MLRQAFPLLFFSCMIPAVRAQLSFEQQQQIDAVFADWNRNGSPGGALAIAENGRIIYKAGYGWANLEHGIPNTPQTVFYAGSVSKQFVAMCILLLREEGKLGLDDDVRRYIPELPYYGRPITIRHMIHHTSGLRDYLSLHSIAGKDYLDRLSKQAMLDMIFRQKEVNFPPGTQYSYSNSGYLLLAEIVERVSGKTLRRFAQEHVFAPLGMERSFFNDNALGLIPGRASGYQRGPHGSFENLIMRFDLVGSGGLYTTVEDLYKWDQNFFANRLGKGDQSLIDTMLTEGRFNDGTPCGYAFALAPGNYRGLPTYGHTGALGGYRAAYLRFPGENLSIILLGNSAQFAPAEKAQRIADILLAGKLQPRQESDAPAPTTSGGTSPSLSPQDMEAVAGRYYSEELDAHYRVRCADGQLFLRAGYAPEMSLDTLAQNPDFAIEFIREGKRQTLTGMRLSIGGMKNFRFKKTD